MDLIKEIEALKAAPEPARDQEQQMELVDELEKVLEPVGVSLQQRFEISLAARVISTTRVTLQA